MIAVEMQGSYAHARALRLALGAAFLAALAALLIAPPSAGAAFHLMKVREVFPGTILSPDGAFIELQMYTSNQNFVAGHPITTYDAAGNEIHSFRMDSLVSSGQSQRTILIGDTAVSGADFTDADLAAGLLRAGGAACFPDASPPDCVSWGNFSGSIQGAATGTPAPAIPDGQSLTRSIARGCATLLESSDDTDDSAADFELTSPTPRPNSATPSEQACTGGGGGGDAPQTKIRKRPDNRSDDRTPTFKFRADEPQSTFQCSVDDKRFKRCSSPYTTNRLSFGEHTFEVRARDSDGNRDPSPARDSFRIVRG
jgi:hypothetical protein